ncbi:MAG TPA: shikimate dehydrogenase [Candidatus Binataceae bacterium]|nr:shikimate dehydrogenase [Candidatus Binataceae bacterium]
MSAKLSGRTLFAAVYGDPVEHSLSPAMHNAAYAALEMDRAYGAFHVGAQKLREALRAVVALEMLGVNLTVPHKERAARILPKLSDEARLLRSVNCVINREGVLHGDNTDARGLETDLRGKQVDAAGKAVVIAGAGGAAASAVLACIRMRAGRIVIANRTQARAAALMRRFARVRGVCAIEAKPISVLTNSTLMGQAALIINATSAGLRGEEFALDYAAAPSDCVFYDLSYARQPTPFLMPAVALERRSYDGAGMLAGQGELAFELFNRRPPPPGVMPAALMHYLGRD